MRTDEVTALLLYEDFIEQVEYELRKHAGKKLVMITMDFSNFNYINNMYGYNEGDKLLKKVADEFLRGCRGFLCGCRMYSDHFAALFEHDNHNDWLQMLTVNRDYYLRDTREKFAASFLQLYIGIYFWEPGVSVKKAIDKANIARKMVKGNHREPICVYLPEYENKYFKDAEMIALLKRAIADDSVVVLLQPKISLETGEVIGAEALARLRGADDKLYLPADFIPTLESVGYITALDNAVLRKVINIIRKWEDYGYKPIPVSVNWSYPHFLHSSLAKDLKALVDVSGVDPKYIEFEITERMFTTDLDTVIPILKEMREEGFEISVDDFGSGYSSFNVMGILPVDTIKIDKGFLDSCFNNERGKQLIQGVIDIIKKVKLQMVCEGVETKEQADMLKGFGCDNVQGYLYDKPLVLEEFEEKYMKKR